VLQEHVKSKKLLQICADLLFSRSVELSTPKGRDSQDDGHAPGRTLAARRRQYHLNKLGRSKDGGAMDIAFGPHRQRKGGIFDTLEEIHRHVCSSRVRKGKWSIRLRSFVWLAAVDSVTIRWHGEWRGTLYPFKRQNPSADAKHFR